MTTTYAVKVQSGQAKIYDQKTGAFKRSVGSNVVTAQIVGDLLHVTDKKGGVKIYDPNNGAFKRSL